MTKTKQIGQRNLEQIETLQEAAENSSSSLTPVTENFAKTKEVIGRSSSEDIPFPVRGKLLLGVISCPSPFFLPGMWAQSLEVQQPYCDHVDECHEQEWWNREAEGL